MVFAQLPHRAFDKMRLWSPEWGDVVLYGLSGVFAALTVLTADISLYRQWASMALGPYLAGAAFMAVVAWRRDVQRRSLQQHGFLEHGTASDGAPSTSIDRGDPATSDGSGSRLAASNRRFRIARVTACVVVFAGATLLPLTMEVIWRSEGHAAEHVQPEVIVVERAGVRVAHGEDPYQVIDRDGHILIHQSSEPVYELYYPYLPGMVLFGFSSTSSMVEARLTDARIQFLVFTVVVGGLALVALRTSRGTKARALQFLAVLPTAALPLATGGDDMPVAALMLLGIVALQRRRPVLAGLALGAASSLKFTAWPLALLAVWAAYDLTRHRARWRYALGFLIIAAPVVAPFAIGNSSAFIDNVIRFPLGLAGVASPAASPLPGHLLVDAFPHAHKIYVLIVAIVGAILLIWRLKVKPPRNAAEVSLLTGWVMLIAILAAPATRVGYLLYPANLFVWAWMVRRAEDPADLASSGSFRSPWPRLLRQSGSGSSKISTVNGVTPADVVGDITTPASQ